MAVKIRLKRTGTKNVSCFRIVAMDARSARDGKAIEEIGWNQGIWQDNGRNEGTSQENQQDEVSCSIYWWWQGIP